MNVTGSCTAEMPSGYIPSFKGIYIASELIIALLAIIGNSLVCLAVICNKKLRTVTNYFLVRGGVSFVSETWDSCPHRGLSSVCLCVKVSLAVADTLVGLVGIPCAVLTDLGRPRHNMPLCLVLLCMLMVLTQVGTFTWEALMVESTLNVL